MPTRDIVVVGTCAGGVEALRELVAGFPVGLRAAVFVVLHLPAHGESHLPHILSHAGAFQARAARDGDEIEHGRILIAPPDRPPAARPGARAGRLRSAREPLRPRS